VTGPQLVVAGPGAGKSEFLVRRAAHLIDELGVAPGAVLTLTFSRRAAADLRDRIMDRLNRTISGVPASTFHSFSSRLLEAHAPAALGWTELPAILTGPEQIDLVAELLATEQPGDWPFPFRTLLHSRTFAGEVTDFILRARERLLTTDDVAELAGLADDWRALPGFMRRYEASLSAAGRIDYGTLQFRAVGLLADPEVARAVADQYRYVIVDEYQDTTLAQAELLAGLTLPHRNLLAAADPYQSVYSFRGTELHNVAEFPNRFRSLDGQPAGRIVLATSFRVPAEILRAAERVTVAGALPGAAGPVEPAPHSGRVDVYVFDQHSQEADWIATEARRMHLEHGIPYARIAVLVRTKRRLLPELSRALERRGIPHEPPDARLTDHAAVQVLFDIVRAAAAFRDLRGVALDDPAAGPIESAFERSLRRVLLGPLLSLGITEERNLARAQIRTGRAWPSLLEAEVPAAAPIATLIEESDWLDDSAVDGFWHMWTSIPQIAQLVASADRQSYRSAWTSLSQVLNRLNERSPATSILDYVRQSDADDIEATPLLSHSPSGRDQITLTTLHQSKGLEFDVVFIADAVEGVFPDLRQRATLLGTERLSGQSSDPGDALRRQLQEEMRLAYTAMTRATIRVVWTATSAGIDEGQLRPSRFVGMVSDAADATSIGPPDVTSSRPVTVGEAEAMLRSVLTDPNAPAHRRLAAVGVLTDPPLDTMRPADQFTLVRERGSDRGILPETLRLSPSQADAYSTCPRRYALERRLRIAEFSSPYATFGSMIHEVLELTEGRALAEHERRSTRAEAATVLDEVFDRYDLGDGAWKAAWRRRADLLLDRLYESWPRPDATPVMLEHRLEHEVDGISWVGIADRIERGPDGLRVVDYKTSKSAPTAKEAQSSLQLGFYMLAANADAAVAELGEVTEAEFWYPLSTTTKPIRFDPANLESVRDTLVSVAAGISAEAWPATPNDRCDGCAVKLVCPEWPEGREAYVR
jgi:superfamily I DNA/RNA helicase/RecB family exonuclease